MKKIVILLMIVSFLFTLYKIYLEPKMWEEKFFELKKSGCVHKNDYISVLGYPDSIRVDTLYADDVDSTFNGDEFVLGYFYKYKFYDMFEPKKVNQMIFVNDSLFGYGHTEF